MLCDPGFPSGFANLLNCLADVECLFGHFGHARDDPISLQIIRIDVSFA